MIPKVRMVADLILNMTPRELRELKRELGDDGDAAGVKAVLPPTRPLREGAAEVDLPETSA